MGIYVNFGSTLPGSCTKAGYEENMEVASFTHGIDRPYTPAGKWDPANFHDFVFTKVLDKAGPNFIKAMTAGDIFDEVVITFSTTLKGEEEKPVYTITLNKVRVTSYNLGGQSQGDSYETVSVVADKAKWAYSVQDEEKEDGQVEYAYNVKTRAVA